MDRLVDLLKRIVLFLLTCVAAGLIGYLVFGLLISKALNLPGLGYTLFLGGMSGVVIQSFIYFFSKPADPEEEKRKQEEIEKSILEYLNKNKQQ